MNRGWIKESNLTKGHNRMIFDLTEKGRKSLEKLTPQSAKQSSSKRIFAYGCLDWTERRYHLGGFLGKVILDSLVAHRIVEKPAKGSSSRALILRKPIGRWIAARSELVRM
jgi:hypothetical protein